MWTTLSHKLVLYYQQHNNCKRKTASSKYNITVLNKRCQVKLMVEVVCYALYIQHKVL
jgi:hypothetical protein